MIYRMSIWRGPKGTDPWYGWLPSASYTPTSWFYRVRSSGPLRGYNHVDLFTMNLSFTMGARFSKSGFEFARGIGQGPKINLMCP